MLKTGETHMTQRHAMHCVQKNKHSKDARTEPCIRGDKKQRQEKKTNSHRNERKKEKEQGNS